MLMLRLCQRLAKFGVIPVSQARLRCSRVQKIQVENPMWRRCMSSSSPKDPRSHIELGSDRTSVTGALWDLRVPNHGTRSPEKLVPKKQRDSLVEIVYDFASDPLLRSNYLNPWGFMRIGKVLEDIDALAGTVANLHADDGDDDTLPLSMVTASVDDVAFSRTLSVNTDVRMQGFVSWVGRSSMEVGSVFCGQNQIAKRCCSFILAAVSQTVEQ